MDLLWGFNIYFHYIQVSNDSAMKYFWVLIFLLISLSMSAQERLTGILPATSLAYNAINTNLDIQPDKDLLTFSHDLKLISVNNSDGTFQRTYMVDMDGETVSSGFMPVTYFMPNHNLIVVTGKRYMKKDSFNPYGASDLSSMLVLTTINSFITKLKIKGR